MRRRNPNELKGKLLDEGAALLMVRGYHGAGLQELAQRVGVPKGSFYNYFDSNDAFGVEVVGRYLAPFVRQLDAHLQRHGLSAKAALRAYFDELIAERGRRDLPGGCLLGNLIGEIGDAGAKGWRAASGKGTSAPTWTPPRWLTFCSTPGRAHRCA